MGAFAMLEESEVKFGFEEASKVLRYEPETGRIFWTISPARRIKAGDEAGILRRIKTTSDNIRIYRYITYLGFTTPAARIAWLLHYGEWPKTAISYVDEDSTNLQIGNLILSRFPSKKTNDGTRKRYKMTKDAQRHYGRMRYYGLTSEDYVAMLEAQKGLCAICEKPETAIVNGEPKQLHVDHCHETNRIRALLCGACNGMLGLAKDSPDTLRKAADYIEECAKRDDLRVVTGVFGKKEES